MLKLIKMCTLNAMQVDKMCKCNIDLFRSVIFMSTRDKLYLFISVLHMAESVSVRETWHLLIRNIMRAGASSADSSSSDDDHENLWNETNLWDVCASVQDPFTSFHNTLNGCQTLRCLELIWNELVIFIKINNTLVLVIQLPCVSRGGQSSTCLYWKVWLHSFPCWKKNCP